MECLTGIASNAWSAVSIEKAREGRQGGSVVDEVVFLSGRMIKLGQIVGVGVGWGGKATALRERPLFPYFEKGQS